MKRAPESLGPAVAVDRRRSLPLHRQIYDGYREAILDGRLRPGQRLPATRTLAQELRVSRIPVVTAFEQLVAEGYLQSRVGAGSFVSPELPDLPPARPGKIAPAHRPGPRRIPQSRLTTLEAPWHALHGPFRASRPALDEFPAELWGRLVAKHARRLSPLQMGYGDPMGLPALREALAQHLRMVRSVRCAPEQIMIVSGSQQALLLSSLALLEPGDGVWLEEPGYEGARDALQVASARIVPVPVDEGGLDVAAGIARGPDAKAVYITPSHQYPLGMIMSAPRRLQLLEWARKRGAWLFEDDYDSEYRYDGQGLSSLQGLDGDARVLYLGTFSKVLFPALRVGYLVIPRDLVARFRRLRSAMDISQEPFHQAVLAELIREGHYARHLRRMRGLYSERRRVLEAALARELPALRVSGDNAGMHLVLMLPPRARDHDLAVRAALEGISVIPLSSCYTGRKKRRGLILGYGSTRLSEIPDAARRLKRLLGQCGQPGSFSQVWSRSR